LSRLGARGVGFESAAVTVAELEALREGTPGVDWKGAGDRVERLRVVKDDGEVAAIRQAIAIGERALGGLPALVRPGDTEKDLADALEQYIRRAGGLCSCFPPIVAVGERAALPHAHPTDRAVRSAGLLLVDWGVTGPTHYKSDLTRVLDTRTNADA